MIEQRFGTGQLCPHGMNAAVCANCSHPRVRHCRHGQPEATCNQCGEDLADTVEETIEELLG